MKTNIRIKEIFIGEKEKGYITLSGPPTAYDALAEMMIYFSGTYYDADFYLDDGPDRTSVGERFTNTNNISAAWVYWCYLNGLGTWN